jgi:hypothetical protein
MDGITNYTSFKHYFNMFKNFFSIYVRCFISLQKVGWQNLFLGGGNMKYKVPSYNKVDDVKSRNFITPDIVSMITCVTILIYELSPN